MKLQPALAIDVGGTTVKGLAVSGGGHVLAKQTLATFGDGRSAIESIIKLVESLIDAAGVSGTIPEVVGVCTPGTVDSRSGVVTFAANLGWTELPLQQLLADRFSMRVHIDHDARAAAGAEAAASGLPLQGLDLLFIPIGTGIASAIMIDGRPLRGASSSAGEIGHVSVYPDGEPCACGQSGCVEAYASASNILARYHRSGGRADSVQDIVGMLDHDAVARRVWAEAIDALARGIVGAVATVDPALVVVGGGLSRAGDTLLVPLRRRVAELLTWRVAPDIRPAALGSESGLIGAALLAVSGGDAERQTFALDMRDQLALAVGV